MIKENVSRESPFFPSSNHLTLSYIFKAGLLQVRLEAVAYLPRESLFFFCFFSFSSCCSSNTLAYAKHQKSNNLWFTIFSTDAIFLSFSDFFFDSNIAQPHFNSVEKQGDLKPLVQCFDRQALIVHNQAYRHVQSNVKPRYQK